MINVISHALSCFSPAAQQARAHANVTDTPRVARQSFGNNYNFIRKPGSDFGWDWGPGFAPAGIYGGVQLHAYSAAYLTGVYERDKQGLHTLQMLVLHFCLASVAFSQCACHMRC